MSLETLLQKGWIKKIEPDYECVSLISKEELGNSIDMAEEFVEKAK